MGFISRLDEIKRQMFSPLESLQRNHIPYAVLAPHGQFIFLQIRSIQNHISRITIYTISHLESRLSFYPLQ